MTRPTARIEIFPPSGPCERWRISFRLTDGMGFGGNVFGTTREEALADLADALAASQAESDQATADLEANNASVRRGVRPW